MEAWCRPLFSKLDREGLCLSMGPCGGMGPNPSRHSAKSATSARTGRNKAIMSHLTPRTLAVVGAEDEARRLEKRMHVLTLENAKKRLEIEKVSAQLDGMEAEALSSSNSLCTRRRRRRSRAPRCAWHGSRPTRRGPCRVRGAAGAAAMRAGAAGCARGGAVRDGGGGALARGARGGAYKGGCGDA